MTRRRAKYGALSALLALLLLAGAGVALCADKPAPAPPPPRLSAHLDRASAKVGETLLLSLDFQLPQGARLAEPLKIGGLEKLSIVEQNRDEAGLKIRLLVDALDAAELGPFNLPYVDKEGKPQSLSAPALKFQVLSNLGPKPEEARPKPLEDIIPGRPAWLSWLPWIGGGLALALLGTGVWWWLRRRRPQGLAAEPQEPPHLRASRELRELEARGWFEQGRVKPYYFGISEILRRYLEALRGFPAAEYTTEEIARHLAPQSRDRELLPLLRQADMVKFADLTPSQARKDEDLRAVLQYLADTAPGLPAQGETEARA